MKTYPLVLSDTWINVSEGNVIDAYDAYLFILPSGSFLNSCTGERTKTSKPLMSLHSPC